ncbi:phage tail assembly chaperone [Pseudomonas protegens]|uniref:phage tail assembly chaperone n=1 Tax=Pseudomonas protegens TaxID=380021 RepID=UPI0029374176|nr:phage tail assembly chaperone [Pseudomonas protegens]WOE81594.1 phage tail assembly chaperone [Pseudomonas protegens]
MNTDIDNSTVIWLYSFESAGWFSPSYNELIPEDCVEVSAARRAELRAGVRDGFVIAPGDDGQPTLTAPPPPPEQELMARERRWRDSQLLRSDPIVTRHRDEIELGRHTTLNAEQYAELLSYRAALRDWPQSSEFPQLKCQPVEPPWLAEQTE